MRLSQFRTLLTDEFGEAYAGHLAKVHHMRALDGRTVEEALEDGVEPRRVWEALCDDMDVPPERRLGVDHPPVPGGRD